MEPGLQLLVKKIEELRSETCCLYVVYVPDHVPEEQYECIRAQLSHGAETGCNFIVVPECIKIDRIPNHDHIAIELV